MEPTEHGLDAGSTPADSTHLLIILNPKNMRKTSIILAIIAVIIGIVLMVGCFFLFKNMPWHITGDKWAMCVMMEAVIAVFTMFISASFIYDYTKD